jgi:hypothetical protein
VKLLDARVVHLWRLQGLIRTATFWAPVSIGVGVFLGFRIGLTIGIGLATVFLFVLVLFDLFWPALAYARYRYDVRARDLLVEQGVLFRQTISIPLDRIQHVDTRQGPIERAFGLARVIVYTAAGMSADGSIPGLEEEEAEHLRDRLARRGDDGV